jgi:hypothetical protein
VFDQKGKREDDHSTDGTERTLDHHPIQSGKSVKLPKGHQRNKEKHSEVGPFIVHYTPYNDGGAKEGRNDALCEIAIILE